MLLHPTSLKTLLTRQTSSQHVEAMFTPQQIKHNDLNNAPDSVLSAKLVWVDLDGKRGLADFDLANVVFGEAAPGGFGGVAVPILYRVGDAVVPLRFQLPPSSSRFGLKLFQSKFENGKETKIVEWNYTPEMMNVFLSLDKLCVKAIVANRAAWMGTTMFGKWGDGDLVKFFQANTRYRHGPNRVYDPVLTTKVGARTTLFDEKCKGLELTQDNFPGDSCGQPLIECPGLWIRPEGISCSWKLLQMQRLGKAKATEASNPFGEFQLFD